MSSFSLNEEQTKLLRICIKHAEPLKPNWEKVREEAELVSTSAASQRWGRLYKLLIGDEKTTPSKGKGKTGGGSAMQKTATNKKATAPKASESPHQEMSEQVRGKSTAQPVPQTPKKRTHEGELDSEVEDETPTKVIKTEIKDEDEDWDWD